MLIWTLIGLVIVTWLPTLTLPLFPDDGFYVNVLRDHRPALVVTGVFTLLSAGTIYGLVATETLAWSQWLWWVVAGDLVAMIILWVMLCLKRDVHMLFMFGIGAVYLAMGALAVVHATDTNPYHVDHGTVVSHDYTAEVDVPEVCSSSTSCTGGYTIPEKWHLTLQDCRDNGCVTGTLDFDQDMSEQYPNGSYYP
jgi:hypothetical protein